MPCMHQVSGVEASGHPPAGARRGRRTLLLVAALVTAAAACGPLSVEGYRVRSSQGRPVHLDDFPHVQFHGNDAYLVGSQWLLHDDSYGWVVFVDEPPELRVYRAQNDPAAGAGASLSQAPPNR